MNYNLSMTNQKILECYSYYILIHPSLFSPLFSSLLFSSHPLFQFSFLLFSPLWQGLKGRVSNEGRHTSGDVGSADE